MDREHADWLATERDRAAAWRDLDAAVRDRRAIRESAGLVEPDDERDGRRASARDRTAAMLDRQAAARDRAAAAGDRAELAAFRRQHDRQGQPSD